MVIIRLMLLMAFVCHCAPCVTLQHRLLSFLFFSCSSFSLFLLLLRWIESGTFERLWRAFQAKLVAKQGCVC